MEDSGNGGGGGVGAGHRGMEEGAAERGKSGRGRGEGGGTHATACPSTRSVYSTCKGKGPNDRDQPTPPGITDPFAPRRLAPHRARCPAGRTPSLSPPATTAAIRGAGSARRLPPRHRGTA